MNANTVSLLFYASIVVVVAAACLQWARLTSESLNRDAALRWLGALDVTVAQQRYQGKRTTVLADMGSGKRGITTYEALLACRTPSGRTFFTTIRVSLGLVVAWDLTPVPPPEMLLILKDVGYETTDETLAPANRPAPFTAPADGATMVTN
ncbi:hypothetical protein ACSFA0_23675 [Variovorax sp. LT1P1]|uniref:hypothetical protein n=1 Tax=Variovorax sp. LT1P1 TaxID=3443730 RepID=UPI003F488AB6